MSSTTTPVIGLFKPVPGTAEPFRVSDLNDNMDLLDAAYGTIEGSIEDVNAALVEVGEAITAANDAAAASTAALGQFEEDSAAAISATEAASDAAIAEFEIESAAAIASLDTDAIITAIANEGFDLDIDGGTA
jgi:hypothetical protein